MNDSNPEHDKPTDNQGDMEREFEERINAEKAQKKEETVEDTASSIDDDLNALVNSTETVDPFKVEEVAKKVERQKEAEAVETEDLDPEDLEKKGYALMRFMGDQTNVNPDELEQLLSDGLDQYNDEDRKVVLKDRSKIITRLLSIRNTSATNKQSEFMNEALKTIKDAGEHLTNSIDTVYTDKSSQGSGYTGQLSGANAAVAFKARLQGLKKIYLHNSGFHVVIRPFSTAELNEFFTTCDQNNTELGHILGGHFFLVHDLFIKKKFMELFPLSVVSSNLKSWRNGTNLNKCISVQDYDTLLWAVCSLMYKKGIQHDLACANKECNHVTKNILLDLPKMRLVNTSIMPETAIEFLMAEKENVTQKELAKYRNEHLEMESEFILKGIRFRLKVPTMQEYIDYADGLYKVITAKAQGPKSILNNVIMTNVIINYNRSFVPWIQDISYMDDKGSATFTCNDTVGIHAVVDELGTDDGDEMLDIEIKKFMKATKVSFIGYQAAKCSKCEQQVSDTVDGFRAWDAQHLFFSLTYRKLEPIGIV